MMLTASGCAERRKRLWEQMEEKPDFILICDPQHQMYFANYFQSPFVFRSTNAGAVLILAVDGSSILVADSMVSAFAEEAHVDERVLPVWYRGRESAPHREAMLVRTALDRLKSLPGTRIGYEASSVPSGIIEGLRADRGTLQLIDVDPLVHEMKRSKDRDEIEIMRRSIDAGAAAMDAARQQVRPGMTELEVYLLVAETAARAAEQQVLVYGDFVSGPRCEKVGGPPTDRRIERGDLVLLDFSVVIGGYRGDFANTFRCGEAPTKEHRRLYEACLEAMAAGEALVRAGRPGREIDAAVRESFAGKHLAENFRSHSGHGLGLGHPDPPYLVPESTDTLVAGDIIAIEPGQYIDGVAGMRFERNYLVTEDGYELLSHHKLQIDATA